MNESEERSEADNHLRALLDYTGAFYSSAIEHGMPAGRTANAVAHVERAARALHALARASIAAKQSAEPVAWRSRLIPYLKQPDRRPSAIPWEYSTYYSPPRAATDERDGREVEPLYASPTAVEAPSLREERAWLIEHSGELSPSNFVGQISWLCVALKHEGHGARELTYTTDPNKALRFAREEDAEAVRLMFMGAQPPDWYSKPLSVKEHMWPLASPTAGEAPATAPIYSASVRDALKNAASQIMLHFNNGNDSLYNRGLRDAVAILLRLNLESVTAGEARDAPDRGKPLNSGDLMAAMFRDGAGS